MIGTLRKHQTWLWIFIIGFTIVSFVIFFTPNARLDMFGGGRPKYDLGSINGKPVSPEEYQEARNDVVLSFWLRYREWPTDEMAKMVGFDLEQQTYLRLALIEKLNQMNIQVNDDATVQWISEFFGASGKPFPIQRYQEFLMEIGKQRFSQEDFERFARHEVGQQHLAAVFGLGGKLVTPQEAQYLYKRDNETMTVEAAFFTASNYLSQVAVTDSALSNYFQLNMSAYRIPERVQVDYVQFNGSNFLAKADEQLAKMTNVSQIAEMIYRQKGGTNFYKDARGNGLSLEEARPKIMQDIRMELAVNVAQKDAADFTTALFDAVGTNQQDVASFQKMAAEKKLEVKQTPLFDEQEGPAALKLPAAFRRTAFRLTDEERYTPSAVVGEDAVYVLCLVKKVPSEMPPFQSVKAKVTEDYKQSEARKLARAAGEKFAKALDSALSSGRKFESVCAAEKVKPVKLPSFSLSTRSMPELKERLDLNRLQNAASRLSVGKSSDFMATEDGGAVIYLASRTPVDDEKMRRELPEFTRMVSEQREYAAYGQWIQQLPQEMQLRLPERRK